MGFLIAHLSSIRTTTVVISQLEIRMKRVGEQDRCSLFADFGRSGSKGSHMVQSHLAGRRKCVRDSKRIKYPGKEMDRKKCRRTIVQDRSSVQDAFPLGPWLAWLNGPQCDRRW